MSSPLNSFAMSAAGFLVTGAVAFVVTPARSSAHASPTETPDWPAAIEPLVRSRCTSCHGSNLIAQQRIQRDDWVLEVAKMRRWGATLTDDEARTLADGLAALLPPSMPDPTFERIEADEATQSSLPQLLPWEQPGTPEYGHALFVLHCASCHGPEARGARGPALVGRVIAQRPLDFDRVVRGGRNDMPAFATVLTARGIANVYAWIAQ